MLLVSSHICTAKMAQDHGLKLDLVTNPNHCTLYPTCKCPRYCRFGCLSCARNVRHAVNDDFL